MAHNRHKKKTNQMHKVKSESNGSKVVNSADISEHLLGIEIRIFKWMLFLFPFIFGLFFEYTAALVGIVLVIFLLYLIKKNGQIKIAFNRYSMLLIFVFLSYLLVLPWSVDWGIGLIGFVKFSTAIVFIIILMQFDRFEIADCFNVIPWSGCVMVILTGMTYFIPDLSGYFIDAGRLGGFFQYANSFALFLLIGIIVLIESNIIESSIIKSSIIKSSIIKSNIINPREIIKILVLIGGVLLSGSRISLIMLAVILIYYAVRSPKLRKAVMIIGIGVLGIIAIIFFLNGNFSSLTRITTVFTDSSTLLGRFLYARDAWLMLLKNPFGLGYMGYYYLQPQFQTGVYITRFVHQEFLQMGLDVGIPAMLAFLFICIRSLFSKRTGKMEKVILAVILIHACFDFDFQYLIILYLLLMTFDLGERKAYAARSVVMVTMISLIAIGIVYGYFFVALSAERLGYQEKALRMLPFHTEIKIYALSQAQSEKAIEYWSDAVLAQNKTIALAYEGKAAVAASRDDYDQMSANMEKMLLNNAYDLTKYQEYLRALEKAMNFYNAQGDHKNLEKYARIALSIPDRLNEVKQRTSKLAYQIDDQPNLELSENEQVYLLNLKEVVDKIEKMDTAPVN